MVDTGKEEKMIFELNVNGGQHKVEAEPRELLVWVLHEKVGLKKTRFGCGIQMCGSCKVVIDGQITHSCATKVSEVGDRHILTREGLPEDHELNSGNAQ